MISGNDTSCYSIHQSGFSSEKYLVQKLYLAGICFGTSCFEVSSDLPVDRETMY